MNFKIHPFSLHRRLTEPHVLAGCPGPTLHSTCCFSRRILLAAFLLSLSQAEARMLSATAEVRWEGIGRDYKKREKEKT